MRRKHKKMAILLAFGVLPFTLRACPGDDDGNAETEDIAPDQDVDVSADVDAGEGGVDVEGDASIGEGDEGGG